MSARLASRAPVGRGPGQRRAVGLGRLYRPVGQAAPSVWTLGRWPLTPATFGRDQAGDLYVGDFGRGGLYRIVAAPEGG